MRILLMGSPNVGKSVIFTRLTGVNVITSNYPGTTVEYTKGTMRYRGERVEVVDAPGTYSLDPTSRAEEVAVAMVEEADLIINVADATNLERSLNLTLDLIRIGKPLIIALNLWDEAKHKGVKIDVKQLEELLGVPCIPTCAITGEGIKELVSRLDEACPSEFTYQDKWETIGQIVSQVQQVTHRHHTVWERLADASVRPFTGIPIALIVLYLSFRLIRFIGEGLIGLIFDPLFEHLWAPLMLKLSALLGGSGLLHGILIGELIDGNIEFMESMGLLTTGLYVPFAAVLPYIFAFYLILSLLEDSGYLPRLAVLVDTFMHRLGLHGLGIIPMLLGLGCNVPGSLSTRILETRRERFIAATIMAIAVPCMAQIAMIAGLVGKYGAKGLGTVFGTLFIIWVGLGILLNRILKGESPEIFVDIPPYRPPYMKTVAKKIWMRVKWFLKEAVPFVLLGVFIVNVLYTLGIIQIMGKLAAPIVTGLFGLPQETVGALLIGFLRKDVAVGMLVPLGLTLRQLIIASVILAIYFPCVATFTTLAKELGLKDMLKSVAIMITLTIIVGTLLNLVLPR
ncbi:ferrous iron transporter B [candidate division bacterium WOR-3 4484_18]|uniref:Ferrous iron transporter B n=1 Tax=candidate division WOR-3 bacterium 4484_18 TaxID=2020626 RepID=A0A257LUC5_UNCW3|nr:MAG: ferrous iron transporter B [candidate division bacterium WOR-3 4484_18]